MLKDPRAHYRLVDAVYRFVLGRPADQTGLTNYSSDLAASPTISTLTGIIEAIAHSEEANALRMEESKHDTIAGL